ncbi:hypothetical protein GCM10022227_11570 [Streptomyces sedi]
MGCVRGITSTRPRVTRDAEGVLREGTAALPRTRGPAVPRPVVAVPQIPHTEGTTMDLLTNVLAGLVHFVGWLV